MSSIAAPAPRLAVSAPARWRSVALPILATVAAELLACAAWLYGNQPIRGDAQGYYDLALQMVRQGPLSFASPVRTYGYPSFLALLMSVVGTDPETVPTAGFVVQLTLFVVAAWVGAQRISRALGRPAWSPWLYVVTVVSPFMLIHTVQMLTDVLSAILVYLAVVLSLPDGPTEDQTAPGRARRTLLLGMLVMLLGGLAVIVRPANLALLPVLLGAWLWRTVRIRDISWRVWPLLLVMLMLPFVPQMFFNARAYGVTHPLLTTDLYAANTTIGMRTAKYATISMTGIPARLYYTNPFGPTDSLTLAGFLAERPLGLVATLGLHAFALFDQDFPFTYITDLSPWYRWPLGVPNYLYVLGGTIGLVLGLRWPPGASATQRTSARFTFGLLGAAVGMMVAIYLPSAVECRFSLPLYPLLAAPFLLTVERVAALTDGRPFRLGLVVLGAAVWVGLMAATSLWLDRQAPALMEARAVLAQPLPPSPSAAYRLDLPEDWEPGLTVTIPIVVTNTGTDTWNIDGFFPVAVRAQFVATKTDQHRLLPKGARTYVTPATAIQPGESANVTATLETPTATGRYVMKITVIRNGIDETTPDFERPAKVDKGR